MEDYIKNKLSEYKPTFKEEYWNTMAVELKKRKRRKFIIFWWLGSISILLLTATIYLYNTTEVDSNISGQAIAIEQNDLLKKYSNSNFEQISTSKEQVEEQDASNVSIGLNGLSNTTKQSTNSIKPLPHNQDASQKNQIKNHSQETKSESIVKSKFIPSSGAQTSPTHHSQKSNTDGQLATQLDGFQNKRTKKGDVSSSGTSNNSTAIAGTLLTPIGLQKLQLLDTHIALPKLPEIEPVNIVISESRLKDQPYAISLAGNLLNTSANDLIHNEEFRFQRVVHFGQSIYYLAAGVGIGRYSGKFSAVDQESLTYRSFASNSMTQSLIPQTTYYGNIPIEFGLKVNRWQFGINLSPEYLIGLHGRIKSEETIYAVQPNEIAPTAGVFSLKAEVSESEKEAWLDQSNVNGWAIPVGANIHFRLNNHWALGASAQYYTTEFYKLKTPVLNYRNITGNTDQMKGGLYVSYQF